MGLVEKKDKATEERKAGFDFICRDWQEYGELFLKKRVYCVSAVIRTSAMSGKAYVLFHLKDAKGELFQAFLFNLGEDLEKKAFKVTSLRGRFLEVSGEVGEFRGETTYYIYEVNVTEKLGNLGEYLGTEDRAMEFLDLFKQRGADAADMRWALASLPQVMDGRLGGFARLAVEVQGSLLRFFEMSGLSEEEQRLWMKVLGKSLAALFARYQSAPDEEVVLGARDVLAVAELSSGMEVEERILLTDVMLGLLGLMQPETVLGRLMKESLEGFQREYDLARARSLLLVGHARKVDGGVLKTPI